MQTISLSESALSLLRRRLKGDDEVTEANRAAYRELEAAGIMIGISTGAGGPESVFWFTDEGWARPARRDGDGDGSTAAEPMDRVLQPRVPHGAVGAGA
jgi:hypothetical protein